jgi:hypothetical protein
LVAERHEVSLFLSMLIKHGEYLIIKLVSKLEGI